MPERLPGQPSARATRENVQGVSVLASCSARVGAAAAEEKAGCATETSACTLTRVVEVLVGLGRRPLIQHEHTRPPEAAKQWRVLGGGRDGDVL